MGRDTHTGGYLDTWKWREMGRLAEAIRDRQTALKLQKQSSALLVWHLLDVALNAARAGEAVAATEAAEHAAGAMPKSETVLYKAACVLALCSNTPTGDASDEPGASGQEPQVRNRAIALLRAAIAAGFDDVETITSDPDLKLLRGDTDFQKILAAAERVKAARSELARARMQ